MFQISSALLFFLIPIIDDILNTGAIMAVPWSAPHSLLSAPHMGLASAKHTSRSELSSLYFVACIRP